ncbi:MAG: hypothetical protein M3Q39_05705, partial [Actinomycetota bacterium]|nr:hypothetical protein [Actinomycetota bacterium]
MSPGLANPLLGGQGGLACASALRGWMVELAGPSESEVTWLTFLLVLLPGTLVGVAFGRAAHLRAAGRHASRALVLAPILLASAILDPQLFRALITTGEGGGALFVVATVLAGGHALSHCGWSPARSATTTLAVFGVGATFAIGTMAAPLTSPRGLWVALLGTSLITLACLAASLPYPRPE